MSLSIDGVWKVDVWAQTVWADGVWREGAPPAPPAPFIMSTKFKIDFPYEDRIIRFPYESRDIKL